MFSLFKKKQTQSEPPLKKKIKDMKCRKINYVDEGFDTLASEMSADPKAILRLKPVNYYAIKNKYIMGKVYTSEDHQENYVQFFRYEYEPEQRGSLPPRRTYWCGNHQHCQPARKRL